MGGGEGGGGLTFAGLLCKGNRVAGGGVAQAVDDDHGGGVGLGGAVHQGVGVAAVWPDNPLLCEEAGRGPPCGDGWHSGVGGVHRIHLQDRERIQ